MSTHDERYLKYLQESFGTTSVPFFGAIIITISFVLMMMIVLLNTTAFLVTPPPVVHGDGIVITKPIIL